MTRETAPLNVKKYRDYFVINGKRIGLGIRHGNYPTKAEAQKAAAILLANYLTGNYAKTKVNEFDKVTVEDAFHQFKLNLKKKFDNEEITISTHENTLNALTWFLSLKISSQKLSSHRCSEIFNRYNIEDFQTEFKAHCKRDHAAYSTRKQKKHYCEVFLRYVIRKGWGTANPLTCKDLTLALKDKAVNRDTSHLHICVENDFPKIYQALETETPFNKTIFHLGMNTGVRQSEIRGLRWGNVDLENSNIFVKEAIITEKDPNKKSGLRIRQKGTKTDKGEREIPIDPEAVRLLRLHKAASPKVSENDIVFPGFVHDALSKGFFRDLMKRLVKRSGVKHITWSALRHFYASHVIANLNQNFERAANTLGHTSIEFSRTQYAQPVKNVEHEQELREAGAVPIHLVAS
tara:strand:- start:864 stop:2078 length:1215 start_codon:yes stop_codon:yes gene_type:complete